MFNLDDPYRSPKVQTGLQSTSLLGYRISLIVSALFSTSLIGPGVGLQSRAMWYYVPDPFQVIGIVVVIVAGMCLGRLVRRIGTDGRIWIGVILGLLALPVGWTFGVLLSILRQIFLS